MTDHGDRGADVEMTPEMRTLLLAGASETIDYDFERGLATHLSAIGGPMGTGTAPHGAGAAAGAGAIAAGIAGSGGLGQGALSAAAATSKAWLGFVALPLGTAAVAVALWFGGAFDDEPGVAAGAKTAASSAPDVPPGSLVPATREVTTETEEGAVAKATASPGVSHGTSAPPHATEARRVPPKHGSSRAKSAIVLDETESAEASVANFPEPPALRSPQGSPSDGKALVEAPAAAAQPSAEQRFDEEVQRRKRAAAAQEKQSDLLRLEMESLAEAKHALGRDPARAFTIARDGERQFGRSVLSEERQHVLILALLELGRFADARRIAAPYLQNHPDSPFARRVQKALDAAGARSR